MGIKHMNRDELEINKDIYFEDIWRLYQHKNWIRTDDIHTAICGLSEDFCRLFKMEKKEREKEQRRAMGTTLNGEPI